MAGFSAEKNSVQPSIEDDIDFSREPFHFIVFNDSVIYQKALEHIKNKPDNMYFEIVCGTY